MIKAYGWKLPIEGFSYRMQIDNVDYHSEKKVISYMQDSGWEVSGSGFEPEETKRIYFFKKDFKAASSWMYFAKKFPWEIIEVCKDKEIYIGPKKKKEKKQKEPKIKKIKKLKKPKFRKRCKICKKIGHISKTCKEAKK
jgi:hypothetical protein